MTATVTPAPTTGPDSSRDLMVEPTASVVISARLAADVAAEGSDDHTIPQGPAVLGPVRSSARREARFRRTIIAALAAVAIGALVMVSSSNPVNADAAQGSSLIEGSMQGER